MDKEYRLMYHAATNMWSVVVAGVVEYISFDIEDCLDYIKQEEL